MSRLAVWSSRFAWFALAVAGLRLHPNKTQIAFATDKTDVRELASPAWSFLGYRWRQGRPVPDGGRVYALIDRTRKALKHGGRKAARLCVEGWARTFFAPLPADTDLKFLATYDEQVKEQIPEVSLPRLTDLFVQQLAAQQGVKSQHPRTPRGRGKPSREENEKWSDWELGDS